MTPRNWAIMKALGVDLLLVFSLACWFAVAVLAMTSANTSEHRCFVTDEFARVLLSGRQ
jgi:hypothetical protein